MRRISKVLFSLLFVVMFILTLAFFSMELSGYVMVFGTLTIILFICLIISIFTSKNEEEIYKSTINKILRTYESILVKSNTIPNLEEKNIILVESFEDLVNAQVEIRKPIYYKMELSCCSFCLLDSSEACIYTLKVNNTIISDLETYLKELEVKRQKKDSDYSLFDGVTNTVIVKLENSKAFRVSPLKKKDNCDTKKELDKTVEELI